MDQREQSRWRRTIGQLLRWRPTRTHLLWASGIAALAFLVIVICGYLFGWKWTGLPTADFSVVDPYRMMHTAGSTEKPIQPVVHA